MTTRSYFRRWLALFAFMAISAVLFLGYHRFVVQPRQEEAIRICESYGGKERLESGIQPFTWWELRWEEFRAPFRQPMRWFKFEDPVTDADIASIAYVPGLKGMEINSRGITDATLLRVPTPSNFWGLCIRNTGITDRGLNPFRRAPLEWLALQDTKATTAGLFAMNFSRLERLEVDYELLADSTPTQRQKLPRFFYLTVFDRTREKRRDWSFLRSCSNISYLCLDGCFDHAVVAETTTFAQLNWLEIRGIRDVEFASLSSLEQINVVDVSGDFSGSGLDHLRGLSPKRLIIRSDRLDSSTLKSLKELPDLRLLETVSDSLSPQSLIELKDCVQLRSLELDRIPLADANIDVFPQLPKLDNLTLVRTRLTTDGVARLQSLSPKLSISFIPSEANPPQEEESQ